MYDPLMPYKEGAADDEVLQQLEDDRQERLQDPVVLQEQQAVAPVEEPKTAKPAAKAEATPTPQPEPQAQEQPPERVEQKKEVSDNFIDKAADALAPVGEAIQAGRELGMAPAAGTVDFLIDTVNMVPNIEIPKYPKYQNQYAQASRELASFIVPTLLLTKTGIGAGVAADKLVKLKVGQSALMKMIGTAGVETGSGVVVDYINANTKEGDNVQGTLKKMFPKTFNWISNDWATLDSDTPEVKRAKSINEGVGLGMFTAFLQASGKLLSGIKGTIKETRFIPESETAESLFARLKRPKSDTPEEAFSDAMQAQEEALDEIGAYMLSKRTNLDEPMLGVHDSFDMAESGVRSLDDMGVIGASVDAVRTQKNIDSYYGRLGSVVSEASLKYGLEASEMPKRTIVKAIVDSIKKGGKYSAELASGRTVSFDEIDEAGTKLAEILTDPRMDTGTMKAVLDEFKDEYTKLTGKVRSLGDVGYNAAMKTIKKYLDDYVGKDPQKAAAYLATSLGGQVSDMAEGARYMEDTEAVARAQEMILDRLEYLFVEKGFASYNKSTSLNFLNTWRRFKDNPKEINKAAQETMQQTDEALGRIVGRAKNTVNSLRAISKERPEYLVPLQMAWEFSDGNIDTLSKLNNFVEQSMPAIGKAFFNGQTKIPNQIVQGAWSTIYNSILTSISTPAKAFFGNTVLMLSKPISVLGGAAMFGDVKTLKRGWYQYSGVLESIQKGYKHMSEVYGRAARNPLDVGYIMREDIAVKNEGTMDVLHSYARAAEQRGENGPLVLYHITEALHDLGNDPVLRFGANAMTALDGFARAVIANGQARAQAYDRFVSGGVSMNPKSVKEAQEDIYNSMFDKNGMITNKAVDYASREIALNLDNDGVRALSNFIAQYPAVKPFLMFPRTSANMISMANKFAPISVFMDDVNKLANPLAKYTEEEMASILTSKGIPVDEYAYESFQALKAEVRGRKAIGTLTVTGAVGLFLNDRLRGNGHFDKERQRVRGELEWKPRTYKGWDGQWYSYDGLGPISDWLALTADVMDNFDSVTENDVETMLNKMGFILSANLTNKSMLAGLEPMNDVLAGNPAALNRWAASFASAFVPLSGARNELGRIIAPQLRELDMEFTQLIRNRNKWTDLMDPKGALPFKYDWIDGKQVGYAENFFTRVWNATMPMKVHDDVSEERQFLMEIEYDMRPLFNKNKKGVEYTAKERSELFSKIGELGTLKQKIRSIMNSPAAKDWKKTLLDERKRFGSADPTAWKNLYNQLDAAIRQAKAQAEARLTNVKEIKTRQYKQDLNKLKQQRGQPQQFPLENR